MASLVAGGGSAAWFFSSGRLDFSAHFVAGFGGATVMLAAVTVVTGKLWDILGVILIIVACGAGVWLELFIFPGGGFDIVDVAIQSLGAVLAGLILISAGPSRPASLSWIGLGVALIGIGAWLVNIV